MSKLEKKVAKNLKKIRLEKGLSQIALGGKCGWGSVLKHYPGVRVSTYESGKAAPSLKTIELLAKALRVKPERFFE